MYDHNENIRHCRLSSSGKSKIGQPTISKSHDDFLMFCYRRLNAFNIPASNNLPDMPLTSGHREANRTHIRTVRLAGNDELIACIPVEGANGQKMIRLETGYVRSQELYIRSALLPLTHFNKITRTGDTGIPCPQAGNKTLYQLLFREEVAFSFSLLTPGPDTPLNYISYLLMRQQNKKINATVAAALVMTQGYAMNLHDETAGQLYWTPGQIKLLFELRKKGSGAEKSVILLPKPDKVTIQQMVKELHKGKIDDTLLRNLDLSGSILNDMDLSYSNLAGANFQLAQLSRATLRRTQLRGTNFQDADLSGADCRNASFVGANLCCADLSNTNLDGANLSGANLTQVNLAGTTLRRTNFTGTILDIATVEEVRSAVVEKRAHKKILLGAKLPVEYRSQENQLKLRQAGLVLEP